MKTLYLLRHAHTLDAPPPHKGDHERVLSPQGVKQAKQVGLFMQQHGFRPDFVLCSSAARAVQTAQLVVGALSGGEGQIPAHVDRRLYHAPAEGMLDEIRRTSDSIHRLLLVGHNPGAAALALRLGGVSSYAPATLSVFQAEGLGWEDFSAENVRLERVFAPDLQ